MTRSSPSPELVRSTTDFRRFLGLSDRETVELCAFGGRQKLQVAYIRSLDAQLRLLAEAETQLELKGSYQIFNLVHEGLYARIGEDRWVFGASRTSDREVVELRAVYVDFDATRPRDISSTDAEKGRARDVLDSCCEFLSTRLPAASLGIGDSGNGYSLFIALEPVAPTPDTIKAVKRFLEAIASRFTAPGVTVDATVCNPARLCPAFGTLKRKGVHCDERPHRPTSFRCEPIVARIPITEL